MYEYQISVSRYGEFFFRTDWSGDRERAVAVMELLHRDKALRAVLYRRNRAMATFTYDELDQA